MYGDTASKLRKFANILGLKPETMVTNGCFDLLPRFGVKPHIFQRAQCGSHGVITSQVKLQEGRFLH